MYRIATVCTGNICRSPMAEFALRRAIDHAGLGEDVSIDSAGVSDEERGNPVDPRARELLERQGLDSNGHTAQQIDPSWFGSHDLLLAMDLPHARALARMAPDDEARQKIRLYRSFSPQAATLAEADLGIPDPWYGDAAGFEDTWDAVTEALPGIVDHVREQLTIHESAGA